MAAEAWGPPCHTVREGKDAHSPALHPMALEVHRHQLAAHYAAERENVTHGSASHVSSLQQQEPRQYASVWWTDGREREVGQLEH